MHTHQNFLESGRHDRWHEPADFRAVAISSGVRTVNSLAASIRPDAATPDNRDERLNQALADH